MVRRSACRLTQVVPCRQCCIKMGTKSDAKWWNFTSVLFSSLFLSTQYLSCETWPRRRDHTKQTAAFSVQLTNCYHLQASTAFFIVMEKSLIDLRLLTSISASTPHSSPLLRVVPHQPRTQINHGNRKQQAPTRRRGEQDT